MKQEVQVSSASLGHFSSPNLSVEFRHFFKMSIAAPPLPQETEIDEDLPKKLVVVEFRSLTVTEGPKVKPLRTPDTSSQKNFKCFCKVRTQCAARTRSGKLIMVQPSLGIFAQF